MTTTKGRARALLHLGLSLLGDPAEQEAEIEPRIDELTKERDELRAMLADKAVLLQEVARLREQATPLTYKEGDRPRLPEMVLWRSEGIWAPLHRDCLRPGDLWLPMPPPPEGQR